MFAQSTEVDTTQEQCDELVGLVRETMIPALLAEVGFGGVLSRKSATGLVQRRHHLGLAVSGVRPLMPHEGWVCSCRRMVAGSVD